MIYRANPHDLSNNSTQPEKVIEKYFIPTEVTTPANGSQVTTTHILIVGIIAALALGIVLALLLSKEKKKDST